MEKKFNIPELQIIYFDDEMATNVIPDSGGGAGDEDDLIDNQLDIFISVFKLECYNILVFISFNIFYFTYTIVNAR